MIKHPDGWRHEASVTINGYTLTFAESMALRVAVTSFRTQLADAAYRKLLGPIADAYDQRLRTVEQKMVNP